MTSRVDLWFNSFMNMPLCLAFKSATWRHWRSTLMWVLYNILGSLMPIWSTYFLLHLYHQSFVLNDFVKHGEFALYTAAFLAPALQQVVRNIRNEKYVLGTGAVLISVTGLVISAIIYSGLTTGATLRVQLHDPLSQNESLTNINEKFLFLSTLALFILSLLFAFVVTLIENVLFEPSLSGMESASENRLQDDFNLARPESASGLIVRQQAASPTADNEELELSRAFTPPTIKGEGQ